DVVRRNIVSRRICHNEVEECVGDALKGAPAKTLSTIILKSGEFGREEVGNVYTAGYVTERFYYGPNGEDGGDIIYQKSIFDGSTVIHSASGIDLICKPSPTIDQCRIAERIWGNCNLTAYDPNAKILTSSVRQKSLLAWLAENTGGQLSCDGGDCTTGYSRTAAGCKPNTEITCDGEWCKGNMFAVIGTEGTCDAGNWTNCCESGIKDSFGNCCVSRRQQVPVDVTVNVASGGGTFRFDGGSSTGTSFICAPQSQNAQYIAKYNTVKGPEYLFCLGTFTYDSTAKGTPFNGRCSGKFFIVNAKTGLYSMPMGGYSGSANGLKFQTYHYGTDRQECPFSFNYNGGNPPQWAFGPGWNASCKLPDPNTINKLGNPAGTPRVFIGDPQ
ncbi:MAG: hypothetical protein FWG18_02015, partial [Alphaproteobacteria bacterium]|nr:hypothetical protein [Alphaproteobacteria bacterium]